jgi:hypothetical protein
MRHPLQTLRMTQQMPAGEQCQAAFLSFIIRLAAGTVKFDEFAKSRIHPF